MTTRTPSKAKSLLYIDMAYDVAELRRQNRQSFLTARNRGGLFDRVFSLHPVAGIINGESAGRRRFVRVASNHIVLDGFHPGKLQSGLARAANLIASQVRMFASAIHIARRPDVRLIIAADVFYLGLMALIAAMVARKPFAVAAYQNQDELYSHSRQLAFPRLLPSRFLERAVQRVVLRNADIVEAPTRNMEQYLIRNGARPERIAILPVARLIDPLHLAEPEPPFTGESRFGLSGGSEVPHLIMISRLIPLKLVEDGVAAMILTCHAVPDCMAVVLGEGPLEDKLKRQVADAGLADRIRFPGKVDQQSLRRICARAIAISPLTGMALVEASLAGSVPVAYDRDWQPEFVIDGMNGFVVPFTDVTAMADRAIRLARDPALFAGMSVAARSAGLAFADPAIHRQREIVAFAPLLDDRSPR